MPEHIGLYNIYISSSVRHRDSTMNGTFWLRLTCQRCHPLGGQGTAHAVEAVNLPTVERHLWHHLDGSPKHEVAKHVSSVVLLWNLRCAVDTKWSLKSEWDKTVSWNGAKCLSLKLLWVIVLGKVFFSSFWCTSKSTNLRPFSLLK